MSYGTNAQSIQDVVIATLVRAINSWVDVMVKFYKTTTRNLYKNVSFLNKKNINKYSNYKTKQTKFFNYGKIKFW
jgi:hypothetical protein